MIISVTIFFVSVIRKYHSEWLKQQEFIFSKFWKLGSTRSRDQPIQFLARALFRVCTWLSSHESSHGREREQASALSVSSYKGTNPIMRSPPSWPHLTLITSQRSHLHIPPFWVRAATYELGRGTHTQFIIVIYLMVIKDTLEIAGTGSLHTATSLPSQRPGGTLRAPGSLLSMTLSHQGEQRGCLVPQLFPTPAGLSPSP